MIPENSARNRLCRCILWLCPVLLLVTYVNFGGGGLGQPAPTSFDDYRTCPRHQRAAQPEELRAERGLEAGELRVAWYRMTTFLPGFGAAQPDDVFVTVIVEACADVAVRHVAYGATFIDFDGLSRGCDLEITAALTRKDHVISDICRLRLEATRTSTWNSSCPGSPLPHVPRDRPAEAQFVEPVHVPPRPPPPFSLLPASIPTAGAGYNLAYWVKANGQLGHDVDIVGRKLSIPRTPDVTDTAKRLPPDILAGTYRGVDVGLSHACAIKNTDNTVACWGENSGVGAAQPPSDLGAVARFSLGGYHACAVLEDDNTVRCWGWNGHDQAQPPLGTFHSVGGGLAHTCGLRPNGQVQCWGNNTYGAVSVPPNLSQAQAARAIAAGHYHNCAIRPDNTVSCWGRNNQGQTSVPPDLGPVRALSAGRYHTCAIRSNGAIACWGDDRYGQISQVPSGTDWMAIHAGWVHTCGRRTNGSVTCWRIRETASPAMKSVSSGINHSCGIRKTDDYIQCWGSLNEIAAGGKTVDGRGVYPEAFKALSVVEGTMCGIKMDDTVDCWGVSSGAVNVPADLGPVKAVNAFNKNACAIKADDTLVCWGTYHNNNANTVPSDLGAVKAVDTGNLHTCAIKADDTLVCWGTLPQAPPSDLGTVKAVSLSGDRTCVIKADDNVQCWGTFAAGGPPSDLGTVKALAVYDVSGVHSCAIQTDDTVVCWDGTDNAKKNPLDSTLEVSAISVGTSHGCGIKKSDSTIVCWGEPTDGAADGPKVD